MHQRTQAETVTKKHPLESKLLAKTPLHFTLSDVDGEMDHLWVTLHECTNHRLRVQEVQQ